MLNKLDFSHEADLDLESLLKRVRSLYPEQETNLLETAFKYGQKAHLGQKRSSGEEYFIHPINVASVLVKLRLDMDSIIAGLLHDVIEDCDITEEEMKEVFGEAITQIVIGCTKISKIKFKTKEESQAENFRKMVVAMAKDIRVIIVKLADRMHNMLTLQYVSLEKQKIKAQETLDIYVPLASRLGINSIKDELEDLCLRYLHPESYYRLAEKVDMRKEDRQSFITSTLNVINEKLEEYSIKAEVYGRCKHFFSIWKKMQKREMDFEQIHDILAFRILVSNITECYKSLGVIHSAFTPIPGRFKDYIAIPKVNGYQSLHTTVFAPGGERIEIQIRTYEMHEVAETGVAAHWKYKEGNKNVKNLDWIQELMEFQQNASSSSDIMDVVKNDLNISGVFVFTPAGDVHELQYGATPLDFAYSIHTEVGNRCVGAKVNGKIVALKYRIKSGDTIEILTSKTQEPSKDWLKIVKTTRARTKIKQYLLKVQRDKNRDLGQEMFEKALKTYQTNIKTIQKKGELNKVFDQHHLKNLDELYISLGDGKVHLSSILEKIPSIDFKKDDEEKEKEIKTYYNKLTNVAKKTSHRDNAVIVDGLDDVLVRMGRCCNPIPGDKICGFITRGRGITVHTQGCQKANEFDPNRNIHVEWNTHYQFKHPVNLKIVTHDRPGILSKISNTITAQKINIRSATAKSTTDMKGSFLFEIEVKDFAEFLKTVSAIESMEEVISVFRA